MRCLGRLPGAWVFLPLILLSGSCSTATEVAEGNVPHVRDRLAALEELQDAADSLSAFHDVNAGHYLAVAGEWRKRLGEIVLESTSVAVQIERLEEVVADDEAPDDVREAAAVALVVFEGRVVELNEQRLRAESEIESSQLVADEEAEASERAIRNEAAAANEVDLLKASEECRPKSDSTSTSTTTIPECGGNLGDDLFSPGNSETGFCVGFGGVGPASHDGTTRMAPNPLGGSAFGLIGLLGCGDSGGIGNYEELIALLNDAPGVLAVEEEGRVIIVMPGAALTPRIQATIVEALGPIIQVESLTVPGAAISITDYVAAEPVVGLSHVAVREIPGLDDVLGELEAADLLEAPASVVAALPFSELDLIDAEDLLSAPASSLHEVPTEYLAELDLEGVPELLVLMSPQQVDDVYLRRPELSNGPIVVPTIGRGLPVSTSRVGNTDERQGSPLGEAGVDVEIETSTTIGQGGDARVTSSTQSLADSLGLGSTTSTSPFGNNLDPSTPELATTTSLFFTPFTPPFGLDTDVCSPLARYFGC